MKNKDAYAVAIRKSDGSIVVEHACYRGALGESFLKKLPFVRGVLNFVDAMALGMRTINYSAEFFAEEESEATKFDRFLDKAFKGKAENVLMGLTTVFAILLSVGIFILLPFYLSDLLRRFISNTSVVLLLEGLLRIAIFLSYMMAISLMRDIRRLYAYHGAEHKSINCIESGKDLTVDNVLRSSRLHRRCGTSFMFFVIFISIIVFFFIRADNIWIRAGLRIALIPVLAGLSYEIIRWAGRSDNLLVKILSAPGMLIQRLTTREPDKYMVEVAIQAVEAVFDWKTYVRNLRGEDEVLRPNDNDFVGDDVHIVPLVGATTIAPTVRCLANRPYMDDLEEIAESGLEDEYDLP
jgi:uncharacterized protein YqhQ